MQRAQRLGNWTRFAITVTAWGITQAISYLLLISGLPLWVTFGVLGAVLALQSMGHLGV
ncbi:hypothetical protein O9992_17320 [Vibrio lentus]|nr:hypothetical protein [Vibrio lentus]